MHIVTLLRICGLSYQVGDILKKPIFFYLYKGVNETSIKNT